LRNAGLYAGIWGRVMGEPTYDENLNLWYKVDDGSGAPVMCCDLAYDGYLQPLPMPEEYVALTGPIQLKLDDGHPRGLLVTTDKTSL